MKRAQLGAMFVITYGGYSHSFFIFKNGLQREAVGLNFQLGQSCTSVAISSAQVTMSVIYLHLHPRDVIFTVN